MTQLNLESNDVFIDCSQLKKEFKEKKSYFCRNLSKVIRIGHP